MSEKVALVTGGNRGIGLEVCRQLAKKRYAVILTARDEEKGREAAGKLGGSVVFCKLDVTDAKSIAGCVDFVQKQYGRLDVLVNNAGISRGTAGVLDATMDGIKEVMNANLYGPMQVSKALYPLLEASEDGRIINVSSGMGALGDLHSNYVAYRLSKAALNAFTIMFAKEVAGIVKVYAMCPGWVRTDMGGKGAPRPVEKGAETAVWLATDPDILSGRFYRDKKQIDW